LRWFRKQAPRKERNLVPPPKTDCVAKRDEKYGQCKTKRSQLIASDCADPQSAATQIFAKTAKNFSRAKDCWNAASTDSLLFNNN
jgi:hypothetical protein